MSLCLSERGAPGLGRRIGLTALFAALVPILGSRAIQAQQAAAAPSVAMSDSSATATDQLAEVLVTASRTGAQNIQQVPMAISVVSPGSLTQGGFTGIEELSALVPSLTIQQQGPGQNEIVIRGLADSTYNPTNIEDQTLVSVYLDDTPISLQGATPDLKIFDLQRVEVLRGPQGTLYGAGAMAGTIRFITQEPNATRFFGYGEVDDSDTAGGGNNDNVRAMVNLPVITSVLAVRINAYAGKNSGFIDNIGLHEPGANWDENEQFRVAARYTPTSRLTVDASVTHTDLYANGTTEAYSDLGVDVYSSITPEYYRDDLTISNLTVHADLGFASLVSSSSYSQRYLNNDFSSEYLTEALLTGFDTASPMLIRNHLHDFAQEVRINSNGSGPLKWVGGIFLEQSDRNYWQDNPTPGLDADLGINSLQYGAFESNDVFSGLEQQDQRQIAEYGELTYSLGPVDLTAGARYFNFRQTFDLYYGGIAGALGPGEPLTESGVARESGVNPRAVVNYHVNPSLIVYTEAAKGYRYGGVNEPVPLTFCGAALAAQGITKPQPTFGPDSLWSYSLGEKSTLGGGRVTLDSDAFLINWSRIQTNDDLSCGYYITQNEGEVRSTGLELESNVRLTRSFTLGVNASYTNARAAEFIANLGAPSGYPMPYSPRVLAAVTGSYTVPVRGDTALQFQGDYQYRDWSNSTFQPSLQQIIPASSVVNLAANFVADRYEIGIFVHDLTNNHVITTIDPNSLPGFQPGAAIYYAQPRTIGVRARVNF
jgi:iron complex outermembrane recepter protein